MKKFRFHLLGLAHIPTHRDISTCAYSQKILKLSKMLMRLGHEVYFYGGEGSEVKCTEFIQCVSNNDRIECYGEYDYRFDFFKHDGKDLAYTRFSDNAIREINTRKQDRDFLLCTMGNYQKRISEDTGLMTVESGIGYEGVFAKYRVFESYAWMHHVYGILGERKGNYYDAVIPNYFDPKDFPYVEKKEDYILYIGRLIENKGLKIAVEVAEKTGYPLIVAGQGSLVNPIENLNITSENVTHVGSVGPKGRAYLMGSAKCVIVPTIYIEPFGGVAVEAQMCGTPVITSDWGAFPETVLHGKTGYRCRTFDDFVWAVKNIEKINPKRCRRWAVRNYSTDRVALKYQEYFENLYDIYCDDGDGWYSIHSDKSNLDWLNIYYG